MYKKIAGLVLAAALLCESLAAQYSTKIDVLKGEQWWGVFVGGEQAMPLSEPFPQTDLSTWVKSNVAPLLISSRGRYIWSKSPFKIEYTGTEFRIESPIEEVEAVTGGKTLREAYLVCCHKNFPPAENAPTPAAEFFTAPVYDMSAEIPFSATADDIRQYAQNILAAGYPAGTLVVPGGWQSTIGSFTPNLEMYGDFAALIRELHDKGFRLMLTVTPFVSGDGPIYRAFRNSGAFVKLSDGRTAMAEWIGGYSAFYDITRETVYEMLRRQLGVLHDSLGVDGFLFDCDGALPYARFANAGAAEFLKKWSELGNDFHSSQYTISRGDGFAPYIHDLQTKRPLEWGLLQEMVSNILTANLLGYPYSTVSADPALTSDSVARDPKVLLRYVQLSSVLPVAALDIAPWRITDPAVAAQCKAAFTARERIGEYYRQLTQESARTAEPIVRHMEYEFPRNGFTDCNDQFMIGSKYLVAPLLGESDSRTVRFPRGVWISRKGERFKGPLVTTVTVADGEIPIFESSK